MEKGSTVLDKVISYIIVECIGGPVSTRFTEQFILTVDFNN